MRTRALPRALLVFAVAVSVVVGTFGSIDLAPAHEHSSSDAISMVRAQDQAVVASDRRTARSTDGWISLLGGALAGLALLLLASRFATDRRYAHPNPIREFVSRSLRAPPRLPVVPRRLVA